MKTHKIIPNSYHLAPKFWVTCGAHNKHFIWASLWWSDVDCKKCLKKKKKGE